MKMFLEVYKSQYSDIPPKRDDPKISPSQLP